MLAVKKHKWKHLLFYLATFTMCVMSVSYLCVYSYAWFMHADVLVNGGE